MTDRPSDRSKFGNPNFQAGRQRTKPAAPAPTLTPERCKMPPSTPASQSAPCSMRVAVSRSVGGNDRAALAILRITRFAWGMPLHVNRAPVLTLWATVVAGRLGHPSDTALTLGRAVAGSATRAKARSIGREERQTDTPRLRQEHVTAPVLLFGKAIRLLPNADGELRAADGEQPSDPAAVERYLAKAFGDHLAEVRSAMETLASRYDPPELNRIGFGCTSGSGLRCRPATMAGAPRRSWRSRRF